MKLFTLIAAVFVVLLENVVTANQAMMEIMRDSYLSLIREGFVDEILERDSIKGEYQKCVDGKVTLKGEEFPCDNVNFLSFLAMKDMEMLEPAHDSEQGPSSADIWGWLSPTGREFTVLALDNGVNVIDSTDPLNPCIIAKMPTTRVVDKWADVKVYEGAMYHVKDTRFRDTTPLGSPNTGIEVYDLLPLDQIDCQAEGHVIPNLLPEFVFSDHGRSHNLVINPESGLLYSVGSEKCDGGMMILDVKTDRLRPQFVACAEEDGYTHDAQCLTYDGPDQTFQGAEICFAYNEDTLTVWDITVPTNPIRVSLTYYDNQVYSHQGWVNDDLTKVLLDDELDEMCNSPIGHPRCDDFETTVLSGETRTTTNVFDITDLRNPIFEGAYTHPEVSVDHNLYVWGTAHRKGWGGNPPMEFYPDPNFAYMANYLAGVKIVDIRDEDHTKWTEAGTFDIAPDKEEIAFAGAWSTYMHPSGVLAVSSIERGLFFLEPEMAFTDEFPSEDSGDNPGGDNPGGDNPGGDNPGGDNPGEEPGENPDDDDSNAVAAVVVTLFVVAAVVGTLVVMKMRASKLDEEFANSGSPPGLAAPANPEDLKLSQVEGARDSRNPPSQSVANPLFEDP